MNQQQSKFNLWQKMKEIYAYLHPNYWKRKLFHCLLVIPMNLILYPTVYFLPRIFKPYFFASTGEWIFVYVLTAILTVISVFFYPFALWWYKQSFIYKLLNNIMFFGGFITVILKIIGVILGGVIIAGFLSPVVGYLTYRKCVKKDMIIGEEKDFE